MLNPNVKLARRSGFTLPEVLVAVAMVGVLSAVVLPSLVGQISKSEVSRVVTDIQSVEQASQVFRTDVGKWPGSVDHLVEAPASTALSAGGTQYGSGVSQWDGPYLARADDLSGGLLTGAGGTISTISKGDWSGLSTAEDDFVLITVTGLTEDEAELISLTIDGVESGTPLTLGKLRYASPNVTYYGSPLK